MLVIFGLWAALSPAGVARGDEGVLFENPDWSGHPGAVRFARDFRPPPDSDWGYPIGGFGGERRGKPLARTPVILVHGNGEDATFWEAEENPPTVVNVRERLRRAGYSDQEVWALSYNGERCGTNACQTSAGANTLDLFNFVQAVREYTGAYHVDIVAHSLGVVVVRRAMYEHPEMYSWVEEFVAAAGPNHGTTVCRGAENVSRACYEIAPGTAWLEELNGPGGSRETPGPTRYMTIYEGTGTVDTYYAGPDAQSPALKGAENRILPLTPHYTLARGEEAFRTYLPFLLSRNDPYGRFLPVATESPGVRAPASQLGAASPSRQAPGVGTLPRTGGLFPPLFPALFLLILLGVLLRC